MASADSTCAYCADDRPCRQQGRQTIKSAGPSWTVRTGKGWQPRSQDCSTRFRLHANLFLPHLLGLQRPEGSRGMQPLGRQVFLTYNMRPKEMAQGPLGPDGLKSHTFCSSSIHSSNAFKLAAMSSALCCNSCVRADCLAGVDEKGWEDLVFNPGLEVVGARL